MIGVHETGHLLNADELVRETRHRVKNSLQLVASMLSAQARQSRDASLVAGLREAAGRIVAVAHLHENLQNSCEQTVQVDDYLRDLCNDLSLTAGMDAEGGAIRLQAEGLMLAGPDALALGLIVNELVTNALRHAYSGGMGPVEIRLARTGAHVVLTVADKGVGRFGSCEGLGLTFVRLLAQKLHGQIEMSDAQPGTRVCLSFVPTDAEAVGAALN